MCQAERGVWSHFFLEREVFLSDVGRDREDYGSIQLERLATERYHAFIFRGFEGEAGIVAILCLFKYSVSW